MKNLPKFFIKNTSVVILLIVGIILLGFTAYNNLPKESFPEVEFPYIIVNTVYRGVSPADMERLVTKEIEKKIKSISGIETVKSTSAESISSIFIEFDTDTDIDTALQKVRDKVSLAKADMPEDIDEPVIQEISFDRVPFMEISLGGNYGLVKLKEVADDLKDDLESIGGILEVNVVGGLEREIQVLVDLGRLKALNLSLDDYTKALMATNVNIPGGTIDLGDTNYLIRIPSEYSTVDEIRNTVLFSKHGKTVYVKDVANVIDTYKKVTSKARTNKEESINIGLLKRSGENVIEVADAAKKVLEEHKNKYFPKGTDVEIVTDMSQDIKDLVDEMENSIILGLLLVTAVLFLFLGFRNSLIVGAAIPLSMLITFLFLKVFDFRLNFIVLFSLILLLGMLVDNAIVVVENIFRHMQEEGMRKKDAAILGAGEVIGPITGSTLTTVFAFLPMAFWPGMIGKFLGYLPKTVITGLLASLFVAIVINPVICSMFLKYKKKETETDHSKKIVSQKVNEGMESLKNRYENILHWALHNPRRVVGSAVIAFVISLVILGTIPGQFFPEMPPTEFWIDVDMPIGSTLQATDRVAKKIENYLEKNENIERYVANVGSKGSSMFGGSSETSDEARFSITLKEGKALKENPEKVLNKVRAFVKTIPGINAKVEKPKKGPPSGAPISVKIVGENIPTLKTISDQITNIMKSIEGVVDIKDNLVEGRAELHIDIDKDKASLYGLNTSMIAMTARTAFNGVTATKFRDGEDEYDVIVKLNDDYRRDINSLRRLSILSMTGQHIPIEKIANITNKSGWGTIEREDYERIALVTADTDGSILPFVALKKIQEKITELDMPEGYRIDYTGENEEMQKSFAFLFQALKMGIILIAMVLVSQFNSFVLPFIIIFTIMLSMIGVVFGLKITGSPFGLMAFMGVISLAGIVVNNGIILIDYIIELRGKGMDKIDAIMKAGKTRLRPVLLTTITTILGLVPITIGLNIDFKNLKFGLGSDSSAYWGPMGSAVIFGLTVATILTLIVVPTLYYMLDERAQKFHDRRKKQEEAEEEEFRNFNVSENTMLEE